MPLPVFILITVLLVKSGLLAQPASSQTLDEMDAEDRLRTAARTLRAIDEVEGLLREMMANNKRACLRAFAHEAYCECVSAKIPFAAEWLQFVMVASLRKDQLKYSELSPDEQELIDAIRRTRDECVLSSIRQ